MKVIILGSGTSVGVPVLGCDCNVCTSNNPCNHRLRASILIKEGGKNILVDTTPDLHHQALANKIERVDAVLFTHAHADHIFGLDELRIFNFIQASSIPIYASPETMRRLEQAFSYIWDPMAPEGGGKPKLERRVFNGKFELFGIEVHPLPIQHGANQIHGFKLRDFAYLTDCSGIPDSSKQELYGLKVIILGALRYRPHSTHFSLGEALAMWKELKAQRVIFTHLSHSFEYEEVNKKLPEGAELAYDGMIVEV